MAFPCVCDEELSARNAAGIAQESPLMENKQRRAASHAFAVSEGLPAKSKASGGKLFKSYAEEEDRWL